MSLIVLIISLTFTWLGMVLGISFLEAPLKFRAPGITRALGLGIGRLVFTALNKCELLFAISLITLFTVNDLWPRSLYYIIPLSILATQTIWLLPVLKSRIDKVVRGEELSKSKHHIIFIVMEVLKIVGLIIGGIQVSF